MTLWCLVVSALLAGSSASSASPAHVAPATQPVSQKVKPVDAAADDGSLRQLRRDILTAAKSRDMTALQRLMAPRVKIDFDKELSPTEVALEIRSASAADQALFWQDLREAVTLGFISHGSETCAPYAVFSLPDVDGSLRPPIGIITSGVSVRRAPEPTAPLIDSLSYDIVAMGPELPRPATHGQFGGQYEWFQIQTPKGELGWVLSKYLREAGARRFCFEKVRGRWKLTGWATGD